VSLHCLQPVWTHRKRTTHPAHSKTDISSVASQKCFKLHWLAKFHLHPKLLKVAAAAAAAAEAAAAEAAAEAEAAAAGVVVVVVVVGVVVVVVAAAVSPAAVLPSCKLTFYAMHDEFGP
jgi:hypothetical protein